MKINRSTAFVVAVLMLLSGSAFAQLSFHDPATNRGILDQVVTEFAARASGWQTVVMNAATWLFWTLGTISLAWTGGMLILRKADIGEFFAEFARFILFFGFYLCCCAMARQLPTPSSARCARSANPQLACPASPPRASSMLAS